MTEPTMKILLTLQPGALVKYQEWPAGTFFSSIQVLKVFASQAVLARHLVNSLLTKYSSDTLQSLMSDGRLDEFSVGK
jgi:hypothetical protein